MKILQIIVLAVLAVEVIALVVVSLLSHLDNLRLRRNLANMRFAKPQYWRGSR